MSSNLVTGLLETGAAKYPSRGVITYPFGETQNPQKITYEELYRVVQEKSQLLRCMPGFSEGSILLLYFDSHYENIVWFWSALFAGCIPAMLPPLVQKPEHCQKHLQHLKDILEDPICLTRRALWDQVPADSILRHQHVDSLAATNGHHSMASQTAKRQLTGDSIAALMLTSGSTGNSKAVQLTHEQILASVAGKSSYLPVETETSFMNWIGLDHVGSLIEIHLHGLLIGVDQVHVQPSDMIGNPLLFIEMIDRHRVARTFAPNFFLGQLRRNMENATSLPQFDLSCLRYIVSGGEANVVETCDAVSKLLGQLGAPRNVIVPGFGMTETCAGSIYSLNCPNHDLDHSREFASVGNCVPGISMRITSLSGDNSVLKDGESGNLEVSGDIVFKGYYNMKAATQEAFTPDGWFKTGDVGMIDDTGALVLSGRTKEVVLINGMKYLPHELEASIEEAEIPGVTPSYTVCFSRWQTGAHTEQLCVLYLPDYEPDNTKALVRASTEITKVMLLRTGARPFVLPLDRSQMSKTTLGKLSRTKLKSSLEKGEYLAYEERNAAAIQQSKTKHAAPANELEEKLLNVFKNTLDLPEDEVDVDSLWFELGVTSMELIKLKQQLQKALGIRDLPITTLVDNPTVRGLAVAIQDLQSQHSVYSPVVTLQSHGSKAPLWLIHPGVGEVLVFLGLARFIEDRPVYALRARGFDPQDDFFGDLDEVVSTYHAAIKKQQPEGPYAVAGYSYGSMLAFEIAKVLESNGDDCRFVGSMNLPPHIKFRMRQLDWTNCMLHLSFFVGAIPEDNVDALAERLRPQPKEEQVQHVLGIADAKRLDELALTEEGLRHWSDLAFAMNSLGRDYDPSSNVEGMDVFYCNPLAIVASSKQEWFDVHIQKWDNFTRTGTRFHEVDGSHYTMLSPEHVVSFQKTFNRALAARGI